MSSLSNFAFAWTLMWAFAYICTALFAPWVGGVDTIMNIIIFVGLGAWMILSLVLYSTKPLHGDLHPVEGAVPLNTYRAIGKIFLFILGLIEVFGGIASWVGLAMWNVPFANKELFQVSMAFADLVSAVFMFYLVTVREKYCSG